MGNFCYAFFLLKFNYLLQCCRSGRYIFYSLVRISI